MDGKGHDEAMMTVKASDEASDGIGEQGLENWSRAHLCYKFANNLFELHPCLRVLWNFIVKN